MGGSTGSDSGQYASTSDLLRQYSASSQPQQAAPGPKPGGSSQSPIVGSAAAVVGGPSLRSAGAGSQGAGQHQGSGSTPTAAAASGTSNVLVPMLDLFSHLRGGAEQAAAAAVANTAVSGGDLSNGMANGGGGYTGMLLRGPTGASGVAAGGVGVSPHGAPPGSSLGDVSSGLGSLLAPGSNPAGSLLGQPQHTQHTQQAVSMQHTQHQQLTQQSLLGNTAGAQGGAPPPPAASGHHSAAAAAAAASLGLTRISIRDALRLALGRLEELVTCPLTMEIMRDPVVAADGFTYERAAIQVGHGVEDVGWGHGEGGRVVHSGVRDGVLGIIRVSPPPLWPLDVNHGRVTDPAGTALALRHLFMHRASSPHGSYSVALGALLATDCCAARCVACVHRAGWPPVTPAP